MSKRKSVIVAMSGGVDSSVAAAILRENHDVTGLHFTKFELPGISDELRARDRANLESARQSARILEIPLIVKEAGEKFTGLVDWFCSEYNAGRTPNPCVFCNACIKWRTLIEAADERGADLVATGHYARIGTRGGRFCLTRSRGGRKDQTYFLHRLTQEQLARTAFPLSQFDKEKTKAMAAKLGLPAVSRGESQEICFVGSGGYREILRSHTPEAIRPGNIVARDGRVLGRHEGYQFYTIGQRKGLGVALGHPAYVTGIDILRAEVTLGSVDDLMRKHIAVADVNWTCGSPDAPFEALVRIRYNHTGARALVSPEGDAARVEFHEPVKGPTPGQAAVFYDGEVLLGGGWIDRIDDGQIEFA